MNDYELLELRAAYAAHLPTLSDIQVQVPLHTLANLIERALKANHFERVIEEYKISRGMR